MEAFKNEIDAYKAENELLPSYNRHKRPSIHDHHDESLVVSSRKANNSVIVSSGATTDRNKLEKKLTMGNVIGSKPLLYDYNSHARKVNEFNKQVSLR